MYSGIIALGWYYVGEGLGLADDGMDERFALADGLAAPDFPDANPQSAIEKPLL